MPRVLAVVGTRPEIIKTLAFTRAAPKVPGVRLQVVHTAQNFGREMSGRFFAEMDIPVARVCPRIDRTSQGTIARSQLDFIGSCVRDFKPDVVISNGDTDTAFYAALAAVKTGVPVAHVEGGIRCEARFNPEEVNRRLADHLANWVFVISPDDAAALRREGFSKGAVFLDGDITLDALRIVLEDHRIPVHRGDYDLMTIHRQENTGDPRRLAAILEGVRRGGQRTIFPVHPRTRQALERSRMAALLRRARNISVLGPQGYLEMVRLAAGCRKIVSDSGGLRREGYMLGKPVISLLWFVWFKEMNRRGFERSVDADTDAIAKAIRSFEPSGSRPPLFGDGRAGLRMLKRLSRLVGRP